MDLDALVSFSQTYPWHAAQPERMVRRFFNQLISGEDRIFDLADEKGRAALAVVIDRVSNPGNNAILEILGIRPDVSERGRDGMIEIHNIGVLNEFRGQQWVEIYCSIEPWISNHQGISLLSQNRRAQLGRWSSWLAGGAALA